MKKILTLFTALFFFGSMMVVQAVTYTPAGTPASVFTNEWTPNTPANDMTLSNGLYVFAKKDNFSATSIQFKVCKDHAWTTAYPGSNYNFTIPNGSKYLIITYNTSGNAVNAFAISSMTVAGDNATLFGSTWTPSATANDMTLQNDGTYKFEKTGVALSAGTVSFKACANHGWTNAWPSDNYSLSIPESGNYTITITFNPATLSVSASADLEEAVVVIPNIQLHSNIKNPSWETTANFDIAGNNETASLTLTGVTKGNYEFGVKIDGTWTSNGSAFTRANNSHAVVAGSSGNCTFNADRNGDYTFTWTYATNTLAVTYPAIPSQSVSFNSLASQILKGSVINLANCVTSSGIDEPTYRFYIKEKNGEYGDAINANYNFNANGEYVVKVEALEYGEPVADDESEVVVYQSYTFTNGSTIYVDFSAMTEGSKGVNYPKVDQVGMDWDATGAGTVKTITFTSNVTWTTMAESFIKTEKNGWANQPFTVPGTGKNCVVVAEDGASYTWGTYVPAPPTIKMHGNFLGEWNTTDPFVVASGNAAASLTLNIPAKGTKEFGMRIGSDDNWTSNGASITRASASAAIVSGSGNCSLNADIPGAYTFTWTYATNTLSVTYPDLPAQSVSFDGLSAEIFKGTAVNFAATSTGITNPVYSFYVKPAGGEYGSAVASYTFNAEGSYTVKVSAEGDNTAAPVVEEANVVVYDTYTFTAGTRIYVDFTAMTEGAKNVNYPFGHVATSDPLDYDENGAGTFKTIRFSENVTWSTMSDFIKTAKAGWAGQKFTIPAEGQNKIIVAADGASYTWGTYTPATVQVKFFAPRDETNKWEHVYAYSWDAAGDISGWITDEVTKDGEWYVYDVQVGANLLFHDNNGMQTDDIENILVAACYEPTAINYSSDPKKVTVVTNSGCEIAYHIAGSAALIGGAADFDTNLPLDENNQIVFHDVEPGTYSFKINNGTWAWAIGGNDHLKSGDCASIATTVGVGDVGFQIDTKQDVTVTYYPLTQEICLGAVTVKATTTVEAADLSIKAGESKKITYTTNNTESPNVTYTVLSGSEYIGLFKGVITGIKPGTATVRVSLAETANYTAVSDEFTITVSNPVAPAKAIEAIGGKFIINAKGDTAVFSRGNLKYNVASDAWYCADHQYDFVGEGGNLHFGDANYTGEFDLFGWSCTSSNYGLLQSNHDEVYTGDFVEWGNLFTVGEHEWATPSGSQFSYIVNHHQWTTLVLDPTPENADNEDEIYGLALFPIGWVMPAGFEQIHYSLHDWSDDAAFADNTIALSAWSTLEAAGAVFMPMAGARAGHWGNTWSGKAETTTKNSNPNGGQSYCFVDNIGWYGYYWSSTTDPRSEHPYDAQYLIFLGWGEGPTEADDDDVFYPPQVWSREKRRGNSVRLVNIVPRQYTVTYTAGEGEGTVPTDENKYLDGAEITLASATGLHKDGYVFAGWKFKDVTYSDTYTVNNVLRNEEIVFEAQWELDWTVVRTGLEINRYYTVCLPKEVVDVRGATFWTLHNKNMEGSLAYLEEETNNLPFEAGKPFIIQATADQLEVIYNGDATTDAGVNGAIHGTLVYMDADALAAAGSDVYMLYQNELRPVGVNNHLDANRAYVKINELDAVPEAPQNAPGRRVVAMPMEKDVTTDINALNAAEAPVKMIIDGNLFILRGEKLYDATGRLVK